MEESFLQQADPKFEKQYQRSIWLIEHRRLLHFVGWGIGITFDLVLLVFSIWTFFDVFILRQEIERTYVESVVVSGQKDLRAFSLAQTAQPLVVTPVSVFSLGKNVYDFYTSISNPNEEWYATFTYKFSFEGEEGNIQQGFILPQEEKPLFFLGSTYQTRPTQVSVHIENIHWHRLNHHEVDDYKTWYQERLSFLIQEVNFSLEETINGQTVGQIHFSVSNPTAFSFWEPEFSILLLRGNSVAGVTTTRIEELISGQTRLVDIHWLGTLPAVSRVQVIPAINILDPAVFMPLEAKESAGSR